MASISSSIISDWVDIYDGELAYRNTITDEGYMEIYSGGTATETTIDHGGSVEILNGGIVSPHKRRILQKKSNEMSAFSVEDT